jgi:putative peptide zinc metalloprotease protein
VEEPGTHEVFEFGEQEAFLVEGLRQSQDEAGLVSAFNARFGLRHHVDDLREFVALLDDWGLLEATAEPARSPGGGAHSNVSGLATAEGSRETPPAHEMDLESDVDDQIQRDSRWHLFKPEPVFDWLDRWLGPVRHALWAVIPVATVFGVAAVAFNWHLVAQDLAAAELRFGSIGRLVFSSLTVNLVAQIFRGVVARHYGLRVPSFGIIFEFGLVPRFNTQILPTPGMAKRERLWLIATSLLVRAVLFGLGTLMWLAARPSGSVLSTVGAELALISVVGFLFVANPLWRADGYQLLSVLSGVPNLRQRAQTALRSLLRGRPAVVARYAKGNVGVVAYGVAATVFMIALVAFLAVSLAGRLESAYRGAGVALFIVVFLYVAFNYLKRREAMRASQRRGAAVPKRPEVEHRTAEARRGGAAAVTSLTPASASRARPAKRRRLGYLVLAMLAAALFLPYPYETGGEVQIYPIAQHEVHAEMDGVIERVEFDGGEWVSQGTVLAQMANHRQLKDVQSTRASILSKERDIARLRTTPSAESLRLAEEQLALARLQYRYSVEEAERIEKLFGKGSVSTQQVEDARKKRDLDRQGVEEKRAGLEALKAQVNPNEIASAEAELQRLREELAFYEEQLRRTSLRMPITGRIATSKLKDLQNKYLEEGNLFALVEDARQVRVEVAIPESEILDVQVGARVRLKTWSHPGQVFTGTVTEIAPQASGESYGQVVKVIAVLPNPDLKLKTGMTGYAKIQAEDTLVLFAFSRALVRFFTIEVWSWLP